MKLILAALVPMIFLAGCISKEEQAVYDRQGQIDDAPRNYVCTVEEMDRVQKEAKFCSDYGGYFDSYCYSSAIIRNCTRRIVSAPAPS